MDPAIVSLQQRTAADLDNAIRSIRSNGFGDGLDLPFTDAPGTKVVESASSTSVLQTKHALDALGESLSKDMKLTEDVFEVANLPRATRDEQRMYLTKVCTSINFTINSGLDGRYDLPFFTQEHRSSSSYRWFRSWLRCAAEDYRRKMESEGHRHNVVPDGDEGIASTSEVDLYKPCDTPARVSLTAYVAAIDRHLSTHRTSELPGNCRWDQVGTIFSIQAVSWTSITDDYITRCMLGAEAFVRQVVSESSPRHVSVLLNDAVNEPALRQIEADLRSKVKELIRPYQGSRSQTLTSHFLRHKSEVVKRFTALTDCETSEAVGKSLNGMTAEVVVQMLAYYDIAMLVFVDNVFLLAVEGILVDHLSTLFLPEKVLTMSEEVLAAVADGADEAELELKSIKSRVEGIRQAQQYYRRYVHSLDMETPTDPVEVQPLAIASSSTMVSNTNASPAGDQSGLPKGDLPEAASAESISVLREDEVSIVDAGITTPKDPITPTRTQQSHAPELSQAAPLQLEGKAFQGPGEVQNGGSNTFTPGGQKEAAKTTLGPDFSIVTPPITPLKQAGRAATIATFGSAISFGKSTPASTKSAGQAQPTFLLNVGGSVGQNKKDVQGTDDEEL